MYRYRKIIHICIFIIIVAIAFDTSYNPFAINDINTMTHTAVKSEDPLYIEITEKHSTYEEAPQNAVIDKVWKKIPGRNGIKVDIEKSYQQMKKGKVFDESLLVYEQVPPTITMDDLPASPIYRGHPEKEMVSFLINVSWGEEHIPHMLNVLKKHKIKATFFIEGKWAKEHSDYVKMIDEQGHVIGNHAYNHPDMARLSEQEIVNQIKQTNEILEAITDRTPKWFAPPSGSFKDQVVDTASDLEMETILWSVDTIDWKNPSVSVMMNQVIRKIHPGAMILMHPTPSIVQGLEPLILNIKENGYKIGSVNSLLSEDR
ncbi:polysaccharide deacetylase family protein [Virgibacillus byunsanensis]|uniref:Polysaccharide deacetylase family protein n=1 Tax=Virgibacillus byunsanensis TaxID=570945 RepID=A0ABW3LHV8_9BACI